MNFIFPCKSSWEFNKKEECDLLLKKWQMTFQASYYKGKIFLDLNNNDNLPTRLTYSKGGAWLKHIGHSNMLYICAARAITDHAPIGEYHLRFFSKEFFACPCGDYPIESKNHILNSCRQFRNYWNPKRDSLKDIITFLEFNPGVFNLLWKHYLIAVSLILSYLVYNSVAYNFPFSFSPSFLSFSVAI